MASEIRNQNLFLSPCHCPLCELSEAQRTTEDDCQWETKKDFVQLMVARCAPRWPTDSLTWATTEVDDLQYMIPNAWHSTLKANQTLQKDEIWQILPGNIAALFGWLAPTDSQKQMALLGFHWTGSLFGPNTVSSVNSVLEYSKRTLIFC